MLVAADRVVVEGYNQADQTSYLSYFVLLFGKMSYFSKNVLLSDQFVLLVLLFLTQKQNEKFFKYLDLIVTVTKSILTSTLVLLPLQEVGRSR